MAENGFVKSEEDLNKAITLGVLLEYTDKFLIPKMSDLMDEKIAASEQRIDKRMNESMNERMGKLEYNLKSYVDRKFVDHTAELFERLDAKYQKEKQFKGKVVEMFKKNNLGTPEDIAFLEGLAS